MKAIIIDNNIHSIASIEDMINADDKKHCDEEQSKGTYDGLREISLPLAVGDKLANNISCKPKYENTALKMLQILLPASQMAEGKLDRDVADAESLRLNNDITNIEIQKNIIKKKIPSNFSPAELRQRILGTQLACLVLFIGEVFLNSKAFQVTGENWLSCLILSASISGAVSLGAHLAGRKYQRAKTKVHKIAILVVSAVSIISISLVISMLRTLYLHKIGVDVDPLWFTVFNIAFFLIAFYTTYELYPRKEEIEANRENLERDKQVQKLEKDKARLFEQLKKHEHENAEKSKEYVRAIMSAEYYVARIKVMYHKCVEMYINANRTARKDSSDCFSDPIPELEIPNINFQFILNKYKNNNHENNN